MEGEIQMDIKSKQAPEEAFAAAVFEEEPPLLLWLLLFKEYCPSRLLIL